MKTLIAAADCGCMLWSARAGGREFELCALHTEPPQAVPAICAWCRCTKSIQLWHGVREGAESHGICGRCRDDFDCGT